MGWIVQPVNMFDIKIQVSLA